MIFAATGFALDDPFITYRYAGNIVHGEGFVYNAGERVQGTTTPLYTLILVVAGAVFGTSHIPMASIIICIAADLCSVMLLWKILDPGGFLPCLFLALYPKAVLIGVSGMEASLVVVFMLLSFYELQARRNLIAYSIFGLLLLTRIDGVIWMCAAVLWSTVILRQRSFRYALVSVACIAPWFVFATLYFGSPLPHSVIAKQVSWGHVYPLFDPVRVLIHYFPFEGMATLSHGWKLLLVMMFLIPVGLDLRMRFRQRDPLGVFPLFFMLYATFFSFAKVSSDIWYYLPGFVSYFVIVGGMIGRGSNSLRMRYESRMIGMAVPASLVVVLVTLLGVASLRWARNPGDWFRRNYVELASWIREHSTRDQSVLLEGIGYVGWKTGMRVYDSVGLVSQDVLDYRLKYQGSDAWYMHFVHDKEPDFIVLRNWEVPRDSLFMGSGDGLFVRDGDREWFSWAYRRIQWDTAPVQDSVHFVVFQRLPQAEQPGEPFTGNSDLRGWGIRPWPSEVLFADHSPDTENGRRRETTW